MKDEINDTHFDLVEQHWVPCRWRKDDGNTASVSLLGLRDVLTGAHEILDISDPSPPVVVALHRLLLAILHRVFGPKDSEAWRDLWAQKQFDADAIHAYLERWRSRFDLFDVQNPFYQTTTVTLEECQTSIAKLAAELASGNNPTLFDHTVDALPPAVPAHQAARWCAATQTFAIGGLLAYRVGEDQKTHKSADNAPLVKGAGVLVGGQNLFETLMLNLHQYDGGQGEPFDFDPSQDRPAWERDEPTRAEDRYPKGYLDLLTWQSRRLRLRPETVESGELVVRYIALMKGNQFPDGFSRRGRETMLAFSRNERATGTQDPWPAVAFREGRALWRDSLALFQSVENVRTRPKTLDWLSDLVVQKTIDRSATLPLHVSGLCTDQAKVLFWRHETMPVPVAYLRDDELRSSLGSALDAAEKAAGALRDASRRLAELISQFESTAKADRNRVSQLVQSLAPDRRYWAALEHAFRRLLTELPGSRKHQDACVTEWKKLVCHTAADVLTQIVNGLGFSPRTLRAVYANGGAQHCLNKGLYELRGDRVEEDTDEPVTVQEA